MNEADSPSINLDELRLLPDWLREEPLSPSKQYAGHQGGDDQRGGDRRGDRGPRRDGFGTRSGGGGPRPQGGGSPRPQGGGSRPDRDRRGPGPRGNDRPGRNDDRGPAAPRTSLPPVTPAPVKIEFLPEQRCLANIVKQIRTTHMAYPLFGTARMFLQEPERHLLRVALEPAAAQAGTTLFQLDDQGPVAMDRQVLERIAYEAMKDRFYVEKTETKEPPKGNFTNVARCRLDGVVLGPTNYHGYQSALRALYESRYGRRMPFEAFRQSIEIVSDPALVERWKNEANTVTILSTRDGEPPTVLQSNSDARAHFRQHHLEGLLHQGTSFELPGSVARSLPEAGMMMAIRQSNENELRYPAQFVQHLRKGLQDAGLHIFKHRKRIVYVAVTRPVPFSGGAVSANVAAILEYVGQKPLCTRKDLASKFLPRYAQAFPLEATLSPAENNAVVEADGTALAPEAGVESAPNDKPTVDPQLKAKSALAADLRFLVQSGHIIEFHNGTFDLPLSAKTREEQPAGRSLPKPNPLFTGKRKPGANAAVPTAEAASPASHQDALEEDQDGAGIATDETAGASSVVELPAEPPMEPMDHHTPPVEPESSSPAVDAEEGALLDEMAPLDMPELETARPLAEDESAPYETAEAEESLSESLASGHEIKEDTSTEEHPTAHAAGDSHEAHPVEDPA